MLDILYENNDFLIINKPAGIMVHADGHERNEQGLTIADIIAKLRPELINVGEEQYLYRDGNEIVLKRPGIVHRLDKDTSGILLIAKHNDAYKFAKDLFQNKKLVKIYHSVHHGSPKEDRGMVQVYQMKSETHIQKYRTVGKGLNGARESISTWRVLARGKIDFNGEVKPYAFMEWIPKTGRTHQIRLHGEYLQKPIVADSLYGFESKADIEKANTLFGFKRHALHAFRLNLVGMNGETIDVKAPYPEDFLKARKTMGLLD